MMKYMTVQLILILLTLSSCGLLGSDGSPDIPGKIVFSADDEAGTPQIYTMNADGSKVRQLTHFGTDDGAVQPSWSPDGRQIVFSTTLRSSSNGLSLYIMDADGDNMRPMNEREGSPIPTPGNHARWSPGGSQIAFDRCVNCQVGTNIELFIYTFATDSVTQLTETDYPVTNSNPTWSPDGSRIAFVSNRDYVNADTLRFRKDLYVVNTNGSNVNRVTESGFPGSYIWMSKNKLIQTMTDRNSKLKDILIVNIETKDATTLVKDLKVKNQLWVFWDSVDQQLFTINKNHEELPVIIAIYDLDGTLLQQFRLNSKKLKDALGFDWYIPKANE